MESHMFRSQHILFCLLQAVEFIHGFFHTDISKVLCCFENENDILYFWICYSFVHTSRNIQLLLSSQKYINTVVAKKHTWLD